MTLNMWVATFAWLLLTLGVIWRKERKMHVPLMLTGILFDIALVLYLQFTREAIQTAFAFRLSALQQIHIGFSTTALLLYFPVLYLGLILLKNPSGKIRTWHIRVATGAYAFRTLGFLFMFSMLGKNS